MSSRRKKIKKPQSTPVRCRSPALHCEGPLDLLVSSQPRTPLGKTFSYGGVGPPHLCDSVCSVVIFCFFLQSTILGVFNKSELPNAEVHNSRGKLDPLGLGHELLAVVVEHGFPQREKILQLGCVVVGG